MKKILTILITFFASLLVVNAAGFKTTLSGNKTIGEKGTITITVGVSNATNLYGFSAPITFDSSKLKLTDSTGLNGFGVAVGTKLVADASSGVNGTKNVAKLTFKALDGFKVGESTKISLGSAEGSDGESIMNGSGSSITITMEKAKSSNNNLKSLSLSTGTINFKPGTTSYSITVDNNVTDVTITAEVEDASAKVTGDGKKTLGLYANEFNVVVTAENGSKKTYTVMVNRKDSDGNVKALSGGNTLESIELTGYDLVFKEDVLEYTILLKDSNSLDIKTQSKDDKSSVTINNNGEFTYGNNVVEIVVTAENGSTKTYKINAVLLDETKTNNKTEEQDTKIITPKKEKSGSSLMTIVVIAESLVIIGGIAYLIFKFKK